MTDPICQFNSGKENAVQNAFRNAYRSYSDKSGVNPTP